MKVKLIKHTPEAEKIVAIAAGVCHSSEDLEQLFNNMNEEKAGKLLTKLLEMEHFSPIEHVTFTFAIEGTSRALTHQLVRHRIASYTQRSQRYVNEAGFNYVIPPTIQSNPEALEIYKNIMEEIRKAYQKLASMVPKEDARYTLPNACETQLVATFNARSLYNFFRLRCCNRAQWEIRTLAYKMLEEVRKVAPRLFALAGPPCKTGPCPEGEMSCKKPQHIYFYSDTPPYEWLSNFYPSFFVLDGRYWLTVEHYFQSQKTLDMMEQEKIRTADSPKLAKYLGRKVELRPDWEEVKEEVMKKALLAKFSQNSKLKEKLLATGNAILHENSPTDLYWGVRGKDRLGQLLMEVREILRKDNKTEF